jgi:putative ABC transport system permease protein
MASGLSAAQMLPALAGAILGVPAGIALFAAVRSGASMIYPSIGSLIAVVLGTLVLVAGLTGAPARFGARRPVAEILQAEAA